MRFPSMIHADAPPERLAAFRIVTGAFALCYLTSRLSVFLQLRDRDGDDLVGVGIFSSLDAPLADGLLTATVVVAFVSGVGYTLGARFRLVGPVFALAMLSLTTYRSSWGQLLHFENLMVLHLMIVGVSAAADAWSFDARRTEPVAARDYSSPLRLACLVVVVAYVIAGVAKLRYGGVDWIVGDTLRNHVAYSAARLDLLGGTPSPLAEPLVERAWVLPPMAAATVAIELAAPVALFGGRMRTIWVAAAWSMHLAIAAIMFVAFPYPLFLVAFAPFFRLERGAAAVRRATEYVRYATPA